MRIKIDKAENGNTKVKYNDLKNVLWCCTSVNLLMLLPPLNKHGCHYWNSLHLCISHKGAQECNRQQPFQQVSNFPTQTDCYVEAIVYAMFWVEQTVSV